jgi:flagellar biosynthetic protein FliQ
VSSDSVLDLWRTALTVTVTVAAPFLIAALAVGLAVAVFQAATQLQESVLSFVPKLAVALVVIAVSGHWMIDHLGRFTIAAFTASAPSATPGSPEVSAASGSP